MVNAGYLFVYIIFFIIIIAIIAGLIYCTYRLNEQDQALQQGQTSIEQFLKIYGQSIINPIPLPSFINTYGSQYKGENLPFLSYDVTGRTVLTNESNNLVQKSLLVNTNVVPNNPTNNDQVWRIIFSATNTFKVANYNKTMYWTIPSNAQNNSPITVTSVGSTFTVNNDNGFLSSGNFILAISASLGQKLVVINNTQNIPNDQPITIYVQNYSPPFKIMQGNDFIIEYTPSG